MVTLSENLQERLENGDLVYFPRCPFSLPDDVDRAFLADQRLSSAVHKNISFDPKTGKVTGFAFRENGQTQQLHRIFAGFSTNAVSWLSAMLPAYASSWRLDRVNFRPEEEATRRLRLKARNDLLHVDAFPSRPTQGDRILRLYVNLHLSEPRVWATSATFPTLLTRYGKNLGLPGQCRGRWIERLGRGLFGLFQPGQGQRTDYDWFMLRFHDYLKANEEFQDRGAKRFWSFGPGSAWLLFSDSLSHADLRGRFEMDHSVFVAQGALKYPEQSPAALLQKACTNPSPQLAA